MQRHFNTAAKAAHVLVNRIVDDLKDAVVQAGAIIRVANIHARALADVVGVFKTTDRIFVVGLGGT